MTTGIAIFAFNRPQHLSRCLDALAKNREAIDTPLFIFCDGPRNDKERLRTDEVQAVAESATGFAKVTVVAAPANKGLARSVIDGVTYVLANFEQVVVVEDDLIVSPHFLAYMLDGMKVYRDEMRVCSIHAYCPPIQQELPETFFIRGADCWGWATWATRWSDFREDGLSLLTELKQRGLVRSFNLDGSYPYLRLLRQQVAGKVDSWAVRWHACNVLLDRYTLYPGQSLVLHDGDDELATHAAGTSYMRGRLTDQPCIVTRQEVREDLAVRAMLAAFFRNQRGGMRGFARNLTAKMARIFTLWPA